MYQILWIFLFYSFAGWLAESVWGATKKKKIINRGFLNGPLCMVYGIAALGITYGFRDIKDSWIFLFLGAAVVSSIVEWTAGKLIEGVGGSRWWDYSNYKGNLDGYVCLRFSCLWGALGVAGLKYVNPLITHILHHIPELPLRIGSIFALIVLVIDALGSYYYLMGTASRHPAIEQINQDLTKKSNRINAWIRKRIEGRVQKAYQRKEVAKEKVESNVFAEGCSFHKLVMLFFIGAFLGDIIETIFCRLTAGVWMSRSSVVWGPFSIVWGLAMAFATLLLYNQRGKSDGSLFMAGTIIGGVYEYLCSVFTEICFGKVFWDYSHMPFNLGGRINLLYCFFWGFAAVIWLKKLYPVLSTLIEKIPKKTGVLINWALILFMIVNVVVSGSALVRYSAREQETKAGNAYEEWIDEHFDDVRMQKIYPNALDAS